MVYYNVKKSDKYSILSVKKKTRFVNSDGKTYQNGYPIAM